jgi:hypothetical protein
MSLHSNVAYPSQKNTFANIKNSKILLKISLGAVNKDPTGWLDRARHANTSIPPFFLGNEPAQSLWHTCPQKIHLQK